MCIRDREKTGRIGTFGHFIITLTDECFKFMDRNTRTTGYYNGNGLSLIHISTANSRYYPIRNGRKPKFEEIKYFNSRKDYLPYK